MKKENMMKQLTGNQIRRMFLDYFKSKGHMIEPGASLIPINDPTLLWINSGVAALKKYFDGSVKPANNRIANAQKSIRTNDIENVGKTARHHTFFEMLGNFSIGDYFKEEALQFAWEFLTSEKWIGFDKNKLYVTVHPSDEEAYRIWTDIIGFDPKRILKSEENYWQIGEGPCGPNSEIYVDRGEKYDPQGLGERLFFEELENDRYIEVWNVVFSQYDGKEGVPRSEYKELPQRNIDTGMGFERLTCLVQQVETNFDTDIFMPIISATETFARVSYKQYPMAYRVIADHIRTVTFALSDGALFANEGRGYVLRRILRRAVRYGIKIGISGSFMYRLVNVVADAMEEFYPYLQDKTTLVAKLVKAEEERFHATLQDGENLLHNVLSKLEGKVLDGKTIFKLYDTYGFPVELTKEIAEEGGYQLDLEGFNIEMEAQRARARAAREEVESMSSQSVDLMNFTLESQFLGYDSMKNNAVVVGLFKNGHAVDVLTDKGEVILDHTCFYAESGGQIADTGTLSGDWGLALVSDVQKAPRKQHLHSVEISSGELRLGDKVVAEIDAARRLRIMANHSSAHLLQAALKKIVGSHIAQAGSFVSDEYMRFDFTHYEKVSDSQLKEIEALVNKEVFAQHPVTVEHMDIDDAKNSGATALFDEKYEDVVRVVTMGDVSKELCGGTHVSNTKEIGVFKIDSEESIGSGIRRITTKSGMKAYQDFVALENQLESIAQLVRMQSTVNLESKIAATLEEAANNKRELDKLNQKMLNFKAQELAVKAVEHQGLNILLTSVEDTDTHGLKTLSESLKRLIPDGLVFLWLKEDDKVTFVVTCSQKAINAGYKAGELAKQAAVITGGNGGGRPDFAQSGGKEVSKLSLAIETIRDKLGLSL